MKNNKCKYLLLILISFSLLQSCKKFLAAKPDKSLALPETLNDLQLMLDNYSLLNGGYPAIGEVSSDNFYLTDASWGSTSQSDQHYYLWQPYDNNVGDYENPNTAITTVNLILESLKKINDISQTKTVQADKIEGSALFFRAFSYWELAQYFCKGYNKVTASSDLGLPIRLSSSVIEKYKRSSVEQTYQQIISDL
ncbi:MAG TPA: RagB/SusD family nutrient uptake outer membrane protein, partial [Arachidicoccus soli]|nr:RagB/SusD family nutrient uptake outer membrane protein [Arachidicoccus soli]